MKPRVKPTPSVCRLVIRPDLVADVAAGSRVEKAAAAAILSCGLLCVVFLTGLGVGVREPWGDWSGPIRDLPRALAGSILPITFFLAFFLGLTGAAIATAEDAWCRAWHWRHQYTRCFLLSFVPVSGPASLWSGVFWFQGINGDVQADDRLDWLADSWAVYLIGHPVWVLVLALAWLTILVYAMLRVRRFPGREPTTCRVCGYDLTGTLKAGRECCPECGNHVAQEKAVG